MDSVVLWVTCLFYSENLQASYQYDFLGKSFDRGSLKLWGAGAEKNVSPHAEGLRIELPAPHDEENIFGVMTRFELAGDFEATASFRILQVRTSPKGKRKSNGPQKRLGLRLEFWDPKTREGGALLRLFSVPQQSVFRTSISSIGSGGKSLTRFKNFPTKTTVGKLRLVRTGSKLHFLVSEKEGGDFRELDAQEVPADLQAPIRLVIYPGNSADLFEMVWTDLKIRAEQVLDTGPEIVTIHNEKISAKPAGLRDGSLVLDSDPPRTIPLDEIVLIDLDNQPLLKANWIGQDDRDFVGPSDELGGNGVQDMHIRLIGVPADREIEQVVALRRHPKQPAEWRLDPAGTKSWRLALRRSAFSDTADLFLEPNGLDNFSFSISITVTFDDGSRRLFSPKATTHTNNELKVTKTQDVSGPPKGSSPDRVLLLLEGGDRLRGKLISLDKDTLVIATGWESKLGVPLIQVLGVQFVSATDDAGKRFRQLLENPGTEDTVLLSSSDRPIAEVAGRVERISGRSLQFLFEGRTRSINQSRLLAMVFAAHPRVRDQKSPYQEFRLTSGESVSGSLEVMKEGDFGVTTPWGTTVTLPAAMVSRIAFRNGKMVFLSDIEPIAVRQTPYFSSLMTYHKNKNLSGGRLRMNGKSYDKGLAVHSRCALTYSLNGEYEKFESLVGFAEEAASEGAVRCRVLGDGRELFLEEDLRRDQPPLPLELSVAGVRQLTLEVDFGENEDIGDRIIWAKARVFRSKRSEE